MFHLRFTPDDISGYTFDFLALYKHIVACETKDREGNSVPLHYHVLIDTDYDVQSVRNAITAGLKIPKAGRGKNNKYYSLNVKWEDPGYICKYDNIIQSKGYTEKQILEYVISGKKKYLEKVKAVELSGEVAPAALPRKPKEIKLPFQQAVIADAAAEWYKYKRQVIEEDSDARAMPVKIVKFVCDAMRKHGRGINQYLVKELASAVLYDDLEYRDLVLRKCEKYFLDN